MVNINEANGNVVVGGALGSIVTNLLAGDSPHGDPAPANSPLAQPQQNQRCQRERAESPYLTTVYIAQQPQQLQQHTSARHQSTRNLNAATFARQGGVDLRARRVRRRKRIKVLLLSSGALTALLSIIIGAIAVPKPRTVTTQMTPGDELLMRVDGNWIESVEVRGTWLSTAQVFKERPPLTAYSSFRDYVDVNMAPKEYTYYQLAAYPGSVIDISWHLTIPDNSLVNFAIVEGDNGFEQYKLGDLRAGDKAMRVKLFGVRKFQQYRYAVHADYEGDTRRRMLYFVLKMLTGQERNIKVDGKMQVCADLMTHDSIALVPTQQATTFPCEFALAGGVRYILVQGPMAPAYFVATLHGYLDYEELRRPTPYVILFGLLVAAFLTFVAGIVWIMMRSFRSSQSGGGRSAYRRLSNRGSDSDASSGARYYFSSRDDDQPPPPSYDDL